MKGKIVWLGVVAFIGVFILGMIVAMPRSSSADTAQSVSSTDLIKTYKNALTEPLNKAIGEVKDRDIADFSQKLVQSFDLDKTVSGYAGNGEMADLVPDIAKIQKNALDTTLKEAGKQLKDKEISDFYNRFISTCGLGE